MFIKSPNTALSTRTAFLRLEGLEGLLEFPWVSVVDLISQPTRLSF